MASDFGTVFMPEMTVARYADGAWSGISMEPSDSISMHPGAHVLHYASTCFEGLKGFRHEDDSVNIFRMKKNVARFQQSSQLLHLPPVDAEMASQMIIDVVAKFKADVPMPPSSAYLRPTHIGLEPAIGKAAAPSATSLMYVLLSPVGDYFTGGEVCLRLLLDDKGARCGHDHGMVKGGGNYASALKHILAAKEKHNADQVLFCPDGAAQETGAANFIVIDGDEVITKALDESFLHGVTRDSILTLAKDCQMKVSERDITIEELIDRAANPECEAGLAGTAAVLTAVGTYIHDGKEVAVGSGKPGPKIRQLREELNAIQWGHSEDRHGWLTRL
ncbi:MAG: branched-chain amino acid aminotransferase [Gammaproteobacteria bacterium]|nr:branched-chain amino acid aminotransferase [Gammaproteobacteria bacterium]